MDAINNILRHTHFEFVENFALYIRESNLKIKVIEYSSGILFTFHEQTISLQCLQSLQRLSHFPIQFIMLRIFKM